VYRKVNQITCQFVVIWWGLFKTFDQSVC